jgi:hypothetical protein
VEGLEGGEFFRGFRLRKNGGHQGTIGHQPTWRSINLSRVGIPGLPE